LLSLAIMLPSAKVFLLLTLFLIASLSLVSSIAINSDAATLTPGPFPTLLQRSNAPSIINSTSMNSTDVVSAKLLRMKVTLPYWTSMVGGGLSFLIAFNAVTWEWIKDDDTLWSFSVPSFLSGIGLIFTFFQNLALLINIVQNYHNLGMVTPITGNAYIVLFAGSATLCTPRVVGYVFPLIIGWINVGMAITNFVLLSLPAVGTVGLYEVYSPYCTVMFDAKSISGCNTTTVQDVFGGVQNASFVCAQQGPALGFGASPAFLPTFVDWGYAGVTAVLLGFMLQRQVLWRVTGKRQPVGFAGKVMGCVILFSLGLAITAWYFASKASAEGSVGVCPGISNTTIGPITGNADLASACTCVELRMPGYVANVKEVLREDEGTLWRLLYDVI